MISGVTKQIGDNSETFRMTTRAMMAIEERSGRGLIEFLADAQMRPKVTDLVMALQECACDGYGVDAGNALKIVDNLGVIQATALLGEIAEAAFPESKEATAKKGTRAPRSK